MQTCHSAAKETFITEVYVIREEMKSSEVVVEGEFASEETMSEQWGWSEILAIGILFAFNNLSIEGSAF